MSQDYNAVLLPIAMTMKAEVKRERCAVLHGGVLILHYSRHDGADTGGISSSKFSIERSQRRAARRDAMSRGSRRGALNSPAVICQKRRGLLDAREKTGGGKKRRRRV